MVLRQRAQMGMIPTTYLKLGAAAVCLAVIVGTYWTGHGAGAEKVQAKWNEAAADHAEALAAQEARHRAQEAQLNAQMEVIQNEGRQKLTELAGVLSGVAVERDSLQSALAGHRERASQDSATAGSCAPIRSAADLYADMLRELQGLAGDYAEAADRARLEGRACEVAYSKVAAQ